MEQITETRIWDYLSLLQCLLGETCVHSKNKEYTCHAMHHLISGWIYYFKLHIYVESIYIYSCILDNCNFWNIYLGLMLEYYVLLIF